MQHGLASRGDLRYLVRVNLVRFVAASYQQSVAFSPKAGLVWPGHRYNPAFFADTDKPLSEALSAKDISGGVVHDLPADLKKALTSDAKALETWEDITPLARNEWICWIESAKKTQTRTHRIEWGCSSLRDGKRRPCCWPGCPHR